MSTIASGHPEQFELAQLDAFLADTSSLPDPYPLYRALRERGPVHWSPRAGFWVVVGFDEAEAVFRLPQMSRERAADRQFRWLVQADAPPGVQRAIDAFLSTMLNLDPPDHTRLRSLVASTFTPKSVTTWRGMTEGVVTGLLEKVQGRAAFDALAEWGYPLPETVICAVLGVPTEDHERWKAWSAGLTQGATFAGRNAAGDELPPEVRDSIHASLLGQFDYFSELVDRRRRDGGEDLVADLIRAEEDGERLSHDELVAAIQLLVGAGHETTANLVSNGLLALMRHPEQYALLRSDPGLALGVVDETLRYDSPARSQPRVATEDLELGGRQIRAGDMVAVIANAANRDPAAFPDPETFDITRGSRRHLSFGGGIHHCVGSALARMEAEVFFRRIGELDEVFELDTDELAYKPNHGRNLTALPVRVC